MDAPSDLDIAVRVGTTGDVAAISGALHEFRAELDEALSPFEIDLDGQGEDEDLRRLDFDGDLPDGVNREFLIGSAVIYVALFVAETLAGVAIEKVVSNVWKKISPALSRLRGRAQDVETGAPIAIAMSTWFAESRVQVVVETIERSGLETAMHSACMRALSWLVTNPRQDVKLVYLYADGEVSREPLVSALAA